jgi:hypothetical protein
MAMTNDAAHLCSFQTKYSRKARGGLLLYSDNTLEWLAPYVLVPPWGRVL